MWHSFLCGIKKVKFIKAESKMAVPGTGGSGGIEEMFKGTNLHVVINKS